MALPNLKGSMSVRKAPQRAGTYSSTPQSSGVQMPAGQAGPLPIGGQAVPAGTRMGGGGGNMPAPTPPGPLPGRDGIGGSQPQGNAPPSGPSTDWIGNLKGGPRGTGSIFGKGTNTPGLTEGVREQQGTPGEGAPPPESDESTDMDEYWQQLLGDDASDWEKKQQALRGEMAGYGREADLINSRMGHSSISGGYASVAGAALGKGMEAYSDAELAHNERRRQMQLEYLQYQVEERRRQEEHGWQQEDQANSDQMHIIDLLATTEMPPGMDPEVWLSGDLDAIQEALGASEGSASETKNGTVTANNGGESYTYTDAEGNPVPLSKDQWNDAQNQLEEYFGSAWTGQDNGPTTAITALLNAGWRPGQAVTREQADAVAAALAEGNYTYTDDNTAANMIAPLVG